MKEKGQYLAIHYCLNHPIICYVMNKSERDGGGDGVVGVDRGRSSVAQWSIH